jgi:ketosteroid isomerase-like protein
MIRLATSDVLDALDDLTLAFALRDAALLLDRCADDITYVGSEDGEQASGRAEVGALLAQVLDRPERYAFQWAPPLVGVEGDLAWLHARGTGTVHTDQPRAVDGGADGTAETFPYRLSGVLRRGRTGWRWVLIHGAEPTRAPGASRSLTGGY